MEPNTLPDSALFDTRTDRLLENAIAISADLFSGHAVGDSPWNDKIDGFMGWVNAVRECAEQLSRIEDERDLYAEHGAWLDWYDVTAAVADRLADDPREDAQFLVECALRDVLTKRESEE